MGNDVPASRRGRDAPVTRTPSSRPRIGFVSLGCPKALVDSERILTQLRTDGYRTAPSYEEADLVVVNTCGFIDSARAESLHAIGEALDANGRVIVTGCLGAQAEEIRKIHPAVLSITGPQQYEQVLAAVHTHAPLAARHDPFTDLVPPQGIKLTPRHYAYLKIAEGCNHKCTFCIIPSMRGRLRSRGAGSVLAEAGRLARAGVRELMIIAQDTSAYGADIRYREESWNGRPVRSRLFELCRELGQLGIWIRLHYVYPYPHVDRLIPLMADGGILPYLDVPLQHGSPEVLKRMRRPAAAEDTLERIRRWRETCPQLTIRSTFIVGFPGETDAEFEALLSFLREAQLDRVGCFRYSPVAGARANELPGAVPEAVKAERESRFMRVQEQISRTRLREKVGSVQQVLIDASGPQGAVGRSHADAPEIDGQVHIRDGQALPPGTLIEALIEGSDEHDLHGCIRR
ncbi:MAG: 30S ribosomal protein S12 methylthiotransferase RimO [Xanthomonadales bacterium]|nr:30S ribosomal protein S12 methylthiotransferase RimO [Xanthomonadales bacterium]NIN59025.1 30S ribosomal protein S12 methylthiotransferase RimO [Xanthomonadales bacterium]NIN74955.1 30S ribosomal protein S12 methylthiotransferase RimO [Xanthomonadales bacterium]NIO13372.1 30S ribosomal protein S12 methylthiotransferase RimO [Xanthomonadales bacterium]NIP11418.1 30S ribosomal protein S12 methylthiotransferase RimO [Xanthomonadales bacterium]